ncbi:MAG: 4a-hydroxytetrahydrobiopterin dehydratase [Alphaproteobacteria bacterium]|nr:4a-hydroxytetrahydrobiopterin dehydratase [Alphaproteobacteria bacterium]
MNHQKHLTQQQIADVLAQSPSWQYDEARKAFCFSYKFDSFSAAFAMMTRIAMLAEQYQHHPDWFNSYQKLDIAFTSHDVGGVTARDVAMVQKIDALFTEFTD